jgi:hypothetical protein
LCFLSGCSGQSGQQKQLTGAETDVVKFGLSQAKGVIPQATQAMQAPLNFFQQLLSGDRSTVMSALSPEISSLTASYDTGRKTSEEFAPRGGGRAAQLEELPFKEASDVEQLVSGVRQTGAAGVSEIGQMLAQLGLGEMGVSSSTAASTFQQLETSKENVQAQGAAAGQAVGGLIALLAA